MLIEAANRLNIQVNILDAANAPAKQISAHDGHIEGSFKQKDDIRKLAKACDILTVEIEHVDADVRYCTFPRLIVLNFIFVS